MVDECFCLTEMLMILYKPLLSRAWRGALFAFRVCHSREKWERDLFVGFVRVWL